MTKQELMGILVPGVVFKDFMEIEYMVIRTSEVGPVFVSVQSLNTFPDYTWEQVERGFQDHNWKVV